MANAILARHPLATLSSDSDLALVLELEDPVLMSPERLEEVLRSSAPGEVEPEVRAYLWGLYDQRRFAPRGRPALEKSFLQYLDHSN